jgi:hypothetical protein
MYAQGAFAEQRGQYSEQEHIGLESVTESKLLAC